MGVWKESNRPENGEFKQVPPGRYIALIRRWSDKETKTGTPYVQLVYRILGPDEHRGATAVDKMFVSANALWRWNKLADALGYCGEPFKLTSTNPEMGAFLQRAVVAIETSVDQYNGRDFVRVDIVSAVTPEEAVRYAAELEKARSGSEKRREAPPVKQSQSPPADEIESTVPDEDIPF